MRVFEKGAKSLVSWRRNERFFFLLHDVTVTLCFLRGDFF